MQRPWRLPDGTRLVRTTPTFDADTTPAGLRRAHRIAAGVWGLLRVEAGTVRFVFEDDPVSAHDVAAGDALVIPPEVRHRVEPSPDARFAVEFHEPAAG